MTEMLLLTREGAFVRETEKDGSYKDRRATQDDVERLMMNYESISVRL
jgi:hypothetical protein